MQENLVVSDIAQHRLDYMDSKFGIKTTLSNTELLDELKIIILSVKPNVMDDVLKEIANDVSDEHLLISVAAGYPLKKMENFLGTDRRLVRVMPNTPSKIGAGASGFCLGSKAT